LARKGNLTKIKTLLKANPKLINLEDKDGATPLHYAVANNSKSVVVFLLANKANVNLKKKNGVTSLHVAAALGLNEIVTLLISKGADLKAMDSEGRTPLSLAESNGHAVLKELLGGSLISNGTALEKDRLPVSEKTNSKIGDVKINPKDGAEMVWIPEGEFLMGSTDEQIVNLLSNNPSYKSEWFDREKPQHKVYLDGYWMYKYEVTVAQYEKFCTETSRAMRNAPQWGWIENHPIANVTWQDAFDYAKWAGASLPTEAQWEKAARGTEGLTWPWGNEWDASKCNGKLKELRMTQPVGSHPADASSYGCMDMAGNVWEWCADWYAADYYATSPYKNPTGPSSGSYRTLRGGGYGGNRGDNYNRSAYRDFYLNLYGSNYSGGFRLAR
jgi:formylglycine-generating enzyme required for sulfatase activity